MSHSKERIAKNCLNCNAYVHGKFCHICGQENLEPAESVWQMAIHFFNDITHFDGKFFSTLKYLVFRPGFLSREYMAGRRASYLNPVRMYIFTSALFFLLFFSFFHIDQKEVVISSTHNNKTLQEIREMDSVTFKKFADTITGAPKTKQELIRHFDSLEKKGGLQFTDMRYQSKEEYDSVLKSGKKQHNWLQQKLITKSLELNKKYNNDSSRIFKEIRSAVMHKFPQILFVSLPLFALLLKLMYVRRKQFFYTNHFVFTLHLFVFIFIMLLVIFAADNLNKTLHKDWLSYITPIFVLSILFYEYKAMRNFYMQGRVKTILKFILINFLFMILFAFIFSTFLFFSFVNI